MKASEIYRLAAIQVYGNATAHGDRVAAAMDAIEKLQATRDSLIHRASQEEHWHEIAKHNIQNDWRKLQELCPHTGPTKNGLTCAICLGEFL